MTARPTALDYSWGRPSPSAMAAYGIKAVCRYLTGAGKAVSKAEIQALHAAGIGVVLNFEQAAGDAKGGASRGKAAGAIARATAKALGAPKGTPIYYSVDFDVTTEMSAVLAYLRAADSADYPARAYGEASVLDAFGRPGWQSAAWSYGKLSKHAVLYQYQNDQWFDGSQVDYNQIINTAQLGAWWPSGLSPLGDSEEQLGDDLTPEEHNWLQNVYAALLVGGSSMPEGKSVAALLGELPADVLKATINDNSGSPVSLASWIKLTSVYAQTAMLATQTPVIQAAVKAAIPAGTGVDPDAVADAVVKALGAKLSDS